MISQKAKQYAIAVVGALMGASTANAQTVADSKIFPPAIVDMLARYGSLELLLIVVAVTVIMCTAFNLLFRFIAIKGHGEVKARAVALSHPVIALALIAPIINLAVLTIGLWTIVDFVLQLISSSSHSAEVTHKGV